jgi:hypothetical protein
MKLLKSAACFLVLISLVFSSNYHVAAIDTEKSVFDGLDYTYKNYIQVIIDGKEVQFDVKPVILKGRTLVPMRAIFKSLGMEVEWDNEKRTARGSNAATKIEFTIDSDKAYFNGEKVSLDVPAKLIDGRTLIPLRILSELLGYKVVWVEESQMILISRQDIIEWRYGGYENVSPYKEYECKFINGVKTSDIRYTGNTGSNSIAMISSQINLEAGQTTDIKITINTALDKSITIKASNNKVKVTPSSDTLFYVTGVSTGETIITVYNSAGESATCKIIVVYPTASRQHPMKINEPINITFTLDDNVINFDMTLKEIIRGDSAWQAIHAENSLNAEPDKGYEWMLAKFNVKVISMQNKNLRFNLDKSGYRLVSSDGEDYDIKSCAVPTPVDAVLNEGESSEGWVAFQVKTALPT